MGVEVELAGSKTRGMTVCDLRPSKGGPESERGTVGVVNVVMDYDVAAIKDVFARCVLGASVEHHQNADASNCCLVPDKVASGAEKSPALAGGYPKEPDAE